MISKAESQSRPNPPERDKPVLQWILDEVLFGPADVSINIHAGPDRTFITAYLFRDGGCVDSITHPINKNNAPPFALRAMLAKWNGHARGWRDCPECGQPYRNDNVANDEPMPPCDGCKWDRTIAQDFSPAEAE